MQADDLQFGAMVKLTLPTMVRVMHHLPDPSAEFDEITICHRASPATPTPQPYR